MTTLHLVTNTPYGGHRGRCVKCGTPIHLTDGSTLSAFTDDPEVFAEPPKEYIPCKTEQSIEVVS